MYANRTSSNRGSAEDSPQMVIPISVDEDSERTAEEIQALFEEYMLPPQQPGIAS